MALDITGSKALYWKTGIDNSGLKKGATKAKGIIGALAGSVSKADVFAGLGLSATAAFTIMSKKAFSFSKDFQTSMKEVQTISKDVQLNYDGISDAIVNMSKVVPDSATKLTQALYQIVSAGYDGAEAMQILEASSKLATGGITDTFVAADTLTSIMNAYGESAGTAVEITDKLFKTVEEGKVDMSQLGASLSQVTGLAAQAGLEFNDLMAIVAKGTKTMKTEQMITGVKGILNAIIKGPAENATKIVEDLGLQFDIASLRTMGFSDFMDDLMTKTGGNIESLQKLFPNVQGLAGLLAVATEEGGKYVDILDEMVNSQGAADKAFKTMVSTADNQIKILTNNVNAKLKVWGDEILATVNNVASSINKMMISATKETNKALANERVNFESNIIILEQLRAKTEKTSAEKAELARAIGVLQAKYPDYLGNINLEKTSYDKLTNAVNLTRKALIEKAKVQLLSAEQKDLITEIANLEIKNVGIITKRAKAQAKASIEEKKRQDQIDKVTQKYAKYLDGTLSMNAGIANAMDAQLTRASEYSGKQLALEVEINTLKFSEIKNTEKLADKTKELTEFTKTYGDILLNASTKTQPKATKNVEATTKAVEKLNKTAEGVGVTLSDIGFDTSMPDFSINFDETETSLSGIMSVFSNHISQLEKLRQAGVDTTKLLGEEWSNFANNVKEVYGSDSAAYQAVINMKKDADTEYLEWRTEQWRESNEVFNGTLQVGLDAYRAFAQSMIDTDMSADERRRAIWSSMKSGFVNLLVDMTSKLIEQAVINAVIGKSAEVAAIASASATGTAVASSWATPAAFASLATLGANAVPAGLALTTTTALAQGLALAQGFNSGGEILTGSNQDKDSVPTVLTKKEIVINRTSAQANNGLNRELLLGINRDKDYIKKNFIPRNLGGEIGYATNRLFSRRETVPSTVNISSGQLDKLINAVQAQTMNNQRQQDRQTIVNITSSLDSERFIVEQDKTKSKMKDRGYMNG